MKPPSSILTRIRAYTLVFFPAVFLMSALSQPAHAAGLFSAVTPLTASVPTNSYLGYAANNGVAYSADGRTALIAATYAPVASTSDAGKAFIYHYSNGQWNLAQEIDDPDVGGGSYDQFGYALALSADGSAALIGSWASVGGQSYAGKAYLYTLANGTWSLAHEFDDPAPVVSNDGFGATGVSISAHGKTVAISAADKTLNGNPDSGEIYVYSDASGSWVQTDAIPDPDGTGNDFFGTALSLAADGTSLIAGSDAAVGGQSAAGKAYFYNLSNGAWSLAQEIDDPAATASDYFGGSAALSADGKTAAISAYGVNSSQGEVYLYSDASGSWVQTQAITDPDATAYDSFGRPIAISGNGQSVLIGSSASVNGQQHAGKAYLYTLVNGTWTQTHQFDDPSPATNDSYGGGSGVGISADGENAFITASEKTVNGQIYAGEAYSYQSPDDISLALSASPTSVPAGNSVTLDATVTNNDKAVTANNVVLTGTLPSGLSYASSNTAGGTCSANGQAIICTNASLAPGATWQPSITATANTTGTFSVSGNVRSDEPDPATSNNAATASITVTTSSTGGGSSSTSSGGGALGLGALAAFGLLLLAGIKRRR